MIDFEFYPTPNAFTYWLFHEVSIRGVCGELSSGSGAVIKSSYKTPTGDLREWITNDLDPKWNTDFNLDATQPELYDIIEKVGGIDWSVGNPAFTTAVESVNYGLEVARVGVALHLRNSIHEVLKRGARRTWLARLPPTGILFLPRFSYQRNDKGKWGSDNVGACWCIWMKDRTIPQFIKYAPEWVIEMLEVETPEYRQQMDGLMGYVEPPKPKRSRKLVISES